MMGGTDMDEINIDVPHRPDFMLTTVDNPYNPFTQWDQWFLWDHDAGYHTPGLLARIVKTSDDLSDADQHLAIQQAIDEIVSENVFGMHKKIEAPSTSVDQVS